MKYKIIISLLICSLHSALANSGKPNLTMLLKSIEKKFGVVISYSPSSTNHIYPENTVLLENSDVKTALKKLIKGLPVELKTINNTYCLVEKKERQTKRPPIIQKETRDTVRLPILKNQIALEKVQHDTTTRFIQGVRIETQIPVKNLNLQKNYYSIRSNLLLLMTGSFNLGINYNLRNLWSIGGQISYNPWNYGAIRLKHLLIRPEVRYWLCDNKGGHFLSSNIEYSRYNIGGSKKRIPFIQKDKNIRFQGFSTGIGIGYGYSWLLTNRFNLEAEIGIGAAYRSYTKYPCTGCGKTLSEKDAITLSPNKLALSLVYIF